MIFQEPPWQTLRYAQGDMWIGLFEPKTRFFRYFLGKAPTRGKGLFDFRFAVKKVYLAFGG